MTFVRKFGSPDTPAGRGIGYETTLSRRRTLSGGLQLRFDRVTDSGRGRRFRRAGDGRLKGFDFLPLDLLLRRAIAQADFVLLGFEPQNLEIVFVAGDEHGGDSRAACGLRLLRSSVASALVAVTLRTAFFDFGDVAEGFDPFGQFDERAEVGGARDFSFDDFADFVLGEPIGPDVLQLFDAERETPIFGVDFQNFGFD